MQIDGDARLHRFLRALGDDAAEALQLAMTNVMDEVIEDAKRRAPVDTGTMRASGAVLPPIRHHGQIVIEAGFGGAASDYVIAQHEDLSLRHTVGEAKFLEKSMLERVDQIPHNLAVRLAIAIRERAAR